MLEAGRDCQGTGGFGKDALGKADASQGCPLCSDPLHPRDLLAPQLIPPCRGLALSKPQACDWGCIPCEPGSGREKKGLAGDACPQEPALHGQAHEGSLASLPHGVCSLSVQCRCRGRSVALWESHQEALTPSRRSWKLAPQPCTTGQCWQSQHGAGRWAVPSGAPGVCRSPRGCGGRSR